MEKIYEIFNKMFNEIADNNKYKAGSSSDIKTDKSEKEQTTIYKQLFFFKTNDKDYTYIATIIVDLDGTVINYGYELNVE